MGIMHRRENQRRCSIDVAVWPDFQLGRAVKQTGRAPGRMDESAAGAADPETAVR
jgi:hypothetical protein